MPESAQTIQLALISHTNAGKTTLARTLLGRDVGEVRDAPHVTDQSSGHTLRATAQGDQLLLWDTPGFGDSARLLRRLRQSGNPLGWLLTQVWDRYLDRPLWCSQQAVRSARENSDVVLYLVNASEDPDAAGYIVPEMEILQWVGKPVILLLNQTGPPRGHQEDAGEARRWREHLARFSVVKDALGLDAFARCWIQEDALLQTVERLLPQARRPVFARLYAAWREDNLGRFHRAMALCGTQLARALADRESAERRTWEDKARSVLSTIGLTRPPEPDRREPAMARLAARLDADILATTDALIRLHQLEGRAAGEILRRMKGDFALQAPVSEGYAALFGAVVSGALGGLAADLAAGGLTFGAATLSGGLLGALGAGGLARGYNMVKGEHDTAVRWSAGFIRGLFRSALLRYLAVAHFGRGRGDYSESEHPAFWSEAVQETVTAHDAEILALWEDAGGEADAQAIADAATGIVATCAARLLQRFYPDAPPLVRELPADAA